jgi:CRP-like cAMP-binding protein
VNELASVTRDPSSLWPQRSFLARLEEPERAGLLGLGTRAVFPDQHVLIRQGGEDDHVILLTKGLTKVVIAAENGCEVLLAIRSGGDLVGEMASLEGENRSATVVSCVKTSARLIPAGVFIAFLSKHPHAHRELTRMLSRRLRFANDQRVAFTALPALARIARILVEVVQTYGHCGEGGECDLGLRLSRFEVASFAAVSLSSAEKSLRRLQESGVITRRSRSLVIGDMPGLRGFAAGLAAKP